MRGPGSGDGDGGVDRGEDGGRAVGAGLAGQGRELVVADEHRGDVGIERGSLGEHAERSRRARLLVVLEEDEETHTQVALRQVVEDGLRRGAVVLDRDRAGTGRRRTDAEHDGLRAGDTERVGGDPEVGRGQRVERLLLRAHHPLQRRVARLVDRVAHGHDGGQRCLDAVVAHLGLALDLDQAVAERELRRLRHERQLQPLGDRGPEHRAATVGGLLPEQDEVGRLPLEHGGEHAARRDQVGAGDRVVVDEHRTVGAHAQGGAQRLRRRRGAHRDDHDLGVAAVLQAQRLFDRVLVGRVRAHPARCGRACPSRGACAGCRSARASHTRQSSWAADRTGRRERGHPPNRRQVGE